MINLKGIIFGVAVFILTLFVSIYGVNSIYDKPEYADFCSGEVLKLQTMDEASCVDVGGKWNVYRNPGGVVDIYDGYCQQDFICQKEYDLAREAYSMNLFLISVPLGILILIGGFYFVLEFVSVGVMVAGVGTILRGIGSYWKYSADWLRFLISLVGLVIVIWFSYRYTSKK